MKEYEGVYFWMEGEKAILPRDANVWRLNKQAHQKAILFDPGSNSWHVTFIFFVVDAKIIDSEIDTDTTWIDERWRFHLPAYMPGNSLPSQGAYTWNLGSRTFEFQSMTTIEAIECPGNFF